MTENPDYLTRQLLTYIGNKRALLAPITTAVEKVKRRLGKDRLQCFDAFSGSGVVARLLKAHASRIVSNDLEHYAAIIGRCYLANHRQVDWRWLSEIIADMNAHVLSEPMPRGFIEELYAPKCEDKITKNDRVFYTKLNARRIDNYRRMIAEGPQGAFDFLLGPLLSEASVHANTAGVFKGFYKNRHTKVGQFGGSGQDALLRILGDIVLELPVRSNFEVEYQVHQQDANTLASQLQGLDLAYLDPPYNQHPYGSNYFMLNLIASYRRPEDVSPVSGIPKAWTRSGYNVRAKSLGLMTQLVECIDAPYLLISFNNEGFIDPAAMLAMLQRAGSVETVEIPYNAFRGSRSFAKRSLHVTERLYLVEKR